jgi:hypothetical protein
VKNPQSEYAIYSTMQKLPSRKCKDAPILQKIYRVQISQNPQKQNLNKAHFLQNFTVIQKTASFNKTSTFVYSTTEESANKLQQIVSSRPIFALLKQTR